MSPVTEAGLTALRELRRNLRSTKGIAMFVLFFLGGAVPSLLQVLFVRAMSKAGMAEMPAEARQELIAQVLSEAYGPATAKYLSTCPPLLFAFLFKGTLIFLPVLILLIGFDQIAGEIQHRSIRYYAGRARRASIVAGKALGVWGVITIMTFVLHATVWSVLLVRGTEAPTQVLSWGIRLWLFTVASAAAYVGLTSLISSFFKTPIVALFVGVGVLFVLWLASTILGLWETTEVITWVFPSTYESKLLISPDPVRVFGGVAALIGWGAAMVAGAAAIVSRRDI